MSEPLRLKTALGTYGHTRLLKDGSVRPEGMVLEQIEINPISQSFKQLAPEQRLDLAETVLTHYLLARRYGLPLIAIPVFPVRQFHHGGVTVHERSGITEPKDLEGKRVGVRTYGVSRGFWARTVLAWEYGVDLDRVTWVIEEGEDIPQYPLPPNVQLLAGANLGAMLAAGELDAGIGYPANSADLKPLIADPAAAEADWYRRTGVYPMNHVVVLRTAILEQRPDAAASVFEAFKAAKGGYLKLLASGEAAAPEDRALAARRESVGGDPLPYGVEPNRPALEMAIQSAVAQHLITEPIAVEELFDRSTLDLA